MRPRLFGDIFLIEAKRQMSYRADFWIGAIGGLISGIVIPYFLWRALFESAGESAGAGVDAARIGGLTFPEMLAYYIVVALVSRVVRGNDLAVDTANDIYEGGLNRYLVYPAGYLPFKYAQHLGFLLPGVTQLVVFGSLFLLILGVPDSVSLSPQTLLMAAASVALANLLHFLLCFPIQLIAFWADNVWSLLMLHRMVGALLGGLLLPLSLFPDWGQRILFCTPFPYLYAVPVNTFMGRASVEEWLYSLAAAAAWCLGIVFVSRLLWSRGSVQYSGVGI